MRAIPPKLRKQIAADPFMSRCVYGCDETPEWEHCWIYSGRQINEQWAIIPVCTYHHRGEGLDKKFNKYVSLRRAKENPEWEKNMKEKYPRFNWDLEWRWLDSKYKSIFEETAFE